MNSHRFSMRRDWCKVVTVAILLGLLIGKYPLPAAQAAPLPKPRMAPPTSPSATVTLGGLGNVMLGSEFSFTATFDNDPADPPTATDPGYGPFIDIIFPVTGADGDPNALPPEASDGVDFVSASYLGITFSAAEDTLSVQTFPNDPSGIGCVDHPWAIGDASGNHLLACGPSGDKLVSLKLPFGSFTPEQPPATVTVNATLSEDADAGTPLNIKARGGYMFGWIDPLDNWCCGDPGFAIPGTDDGTGWPNGDVIPTVLDITKGYVGPGNVQDETATGPNFQRQYTLTVDIADGQTITDLDVTDILDDNVQYIGIDAGSTTGGYSIISEPDNVPPETPGGTLTLRYASATGTDATNDVVVTFDFYIPRLEAGGLTNVINPATGNDVNSDDDAGAGGTWDTHDPRDADTPISTAANCPPTCPTLHTLQDKSIAIQKSVQNITDASNSPGDVLEYTLTFQVSDFFAFNDLVVSDMISDGQQYDAGFSPTFQVDGNDFTFGSAAFNVANYTVDTSQIDLTDGPPPAPENPATDGTTTLTFRVSDELITRAPSLPAGDTRTHVENGRLLGGCVDRVIGDGNDLMTCTLASPGDGPTAVTIIFHTQIQDSFTDDYPSGDWSVDQGDVLGNDATVDSIVLDNTSFAVGQPEADDATAGLSIGTGSLTKKIYAVNGAAPGSPVRVKPGDKVTYRITYVMPTGDEENMRFDDYLPLPVFIVDDPDQNGTSGAGDPPPWTFDASISGGVGDVPAAGEAMFGPDDTFYNYSTIVPSVSHDTVNNSLTFDYGDFDGLTEQPYTVDILFTATVSDDPFADGLYLTNQAHAYEGSTNSGEVSADAIVQIILTEPVLVSTKSVVATDNPNATFTPAIAAPIVFNAPGSGYPRWNGDITSDYLAAHPIDSNISGIDAGDLVTFAIVIENTGSSLKGAFDIILKDTLPAQFQIPTGGLNLQASYGDHDAGTQPQIPYTGLGGGGAGSDDDIFYNGIQLNDPIGQGICQAYNPNSGRNTILVTFDLQAINDIPPGVVINTSSLTNYAGEEGGPNHLPEDQEDDAMATVLASFEKDLVSTEINNPNNGNNQVVVGELITYRLTSTVPEGEVPGAFITDHLDGGLAFVSCTGVVASSSDVTTDLAGETVEFDSVCTTTEASGITNNGQDIRFNLGNITNANRDNSTAETITITYQVVALNVSGTQSGVQRNNAAAFRMNDGSGDVTLDNDSAPNVRVLEPVVTTTKTVNPTTADAGDSVHYTITLTNTGGTYGTDAYDLTWTDTVQPDLTYVSGSLQFGACAATSRSLNVSGSALSATLSDLPDGASCVIEYDATVDYSVVPNQTITNTAETEWTSLSGAPGQRSTYNTNSTERTGSGSPTVNDYVHQDTADLLISNIAPEKVIQETSEASSAATDVAIGEIVRYRITAIVPEGTSPTTQVRDLLPDGLLFLDDGTAKLALVSRDDTACLGGPTLISSTLGTAPWTCGDEDNIAAITPTYTLPASAIQNGTSPGNPFDNGHDPYFNLGNLNNNDSDINSEYALIEFNVLVMNVNGNQNGDALGNQYEVWVNGIQINTSTTATVTVIEPVLALDKTNSAISVLPNLTLDAGDTITYTITIENLGANGSTADAFDVHFIDTLPALDLDLQIASVTVTGGSGTVTDLSSDANNRVEVIIDEITLGETITITYEAIVLTSVTPSQAINNTGDLTWTSLPDEQGTTSNGTGSSTPGNSGDDDGERNGNGAGANDHLDTDTSSFDIHDPYFSKSLDTTSASHTADPALAIGEVATFGLYVTLPEGTTPAITIVDDLPVGLEYVTNSWQLVTQTSPPATCGTLTADFNGAAPSPTVTAVGGSGGDLTFDFGSISVTDDNITNNNTFLICFEAVVLNEAGNQQSPPPLTNTATMTIGGVDYTDNEVVNIVESVLDISKAVSDSTPGNGQVVTFTLNIAHDPTSAADAFDVLIVDDLPADLVLDLSSVQITTSGVVGVADQSSGNRVQVLVSTFPTAGNVTITYEATVAAPTGTTINNVGEVEWTSLQGTDTNERTGDDGPGGALNDYAAASSVSLSATRDLEKSLIADNHAVTASPDVTIGELLTYQVILTIPAGSTDMAIITDSLDDGLAFVDCSQITAGPNITSTTVDFSNPNNCNHGTVAGSNPLISNSGHTATFDLGDITNTGAAQPITLTYRVVALDIVDNVRNVILDNDVEWTWATGQLGAQALPSLRIIEPDLNIEKTVNTTVAIPGSVVTYTIRIFHTGDSQTNAYDSLIQDVVPERVTYVAGSLMHVAGSGPAPDILDDTAIDPATGSPLLTARWNELLLGTESSIQFQATVGALRPGQSVTNTTSLEWTSLPGVPTAAPGQPTGVQSPYNANSTERRYDPLNPADFYGITASVSISVPRRLPETGFAPGRMTTLPPQPADKTYQDLGDFWLEVPSLNIKAPIVGAPVRSNDWDLTWLDGKAGWLEGTAYPTWEGNSVITAHVYLPNGDPGPFVDLQSLRWGDQIIVHAYGQRYVYEVRTNQKVSPNANILQHEEYPWLTLLTCQGYDEKNNLYKSRIVVRAVQVSVLPGP